MVSSASVEAYRENAEGELDECCSKPEKKHSRKRCIVKGDGSEIITFSSSKFNPRIRRGAFFKRFLSRDAGTAAPDAAGGYSTGGRERAEFAGRAGIRLGREWLRQNDINLPSVQRVGCTPTLRVVRVVSMNRGRKRAGRKRTANTRLGTFTRRSRRVLRERRRGRGCAAVRFLRDGFGRGGDVPRTATRLPYDGIGRDGGELQRRAFDAAGFTI